MNLEQALQENTAALKALTAALGIKAPDTKAGPTAIRSMGQAFAPAPEAPKAVTYDDIKKAGNALIVKHGREVLLKVLEARQLQKANDAKPEEFPELLAAIITALAVAKS